MDQNKINNLLLDDAISQDLKNKIKILFKHYENEDGNKIIPKEILEYIDTVNNMELLDNKLTLLTENNYDLNMIEKKQQKEQLAQQQQQIDQQQQQQQLKQQDAQQLLQQKNNLN